MEIALTKAKNENDFKDCWPVVQELRPHLTWDAFVSMVPEMIQEGYHLLMARHSNGTIVAFAGYRYMQTLFDGKMIYIDDLCSLPEYRGNGYANALLDHIIEEASSKGYKFVSLDSGFQRLDAHRLYLNKGFIISSLHFRKKLT